MSNEQAEWWDIHASKVLGPILYNNRELFGKACFEWGLTTHPSYMFKFREPSDGYFHLSV